MDNNDKLYQQIKDAVENSESTAFPAMDKVWGRVEEKLDKKELKKENNLWKKIAIAASLLLIATLGYNFLRDKTAETKNEVVTTDSVRNQIPQLIQDKNIVGAPTVNPKLKPEAVAILDRQINKQQVANNDNVVSSSSAVQPLLYESDKKESETVSIFPRPAVSKAESTDEVEMMVDKRSGQTVPQKNEPLLVVDGKAIKKTDPHQTVSKELSHIDAEDVKEIAVLNEPLYIINGVQYSENELFGVNPTSPYAPLNSQEIESIFVLQGEKAIGEYGDKGKKGVVIITTKYGKPAKVTKGK